ncbi:uncharacterized protein PV07_08581 [Cladophialophora immunda]|uniref:Uncharacterized protein n=1 Tax=Cladophialophora immunda TaxID=569365 RepID=A0A0D2CPB0_9EURO|nr:uncharacterized protein PV07_08581 [Cladophialophora immunda]KIW25404.1 hypothetical protein PV07_08581 [Cladophialophora immunda]
MQPTPFDRPYKTTPSKSPFTQDFALHIYLSTAIYASVPQRRQIRETPSHQECPFASHSGFLVEFIPAANTGSASPQLAAQETDPSLFNYTSGGWFYDEHRRLAERYLEFNVTELKRAVVQPSY